MSLFRQTRIRLLVALFALAGACLHVGLAPRHALMQLAQPAETQSSELAWAIANDIPICHQIAPSGDDGAPERNPAHKQHPCLVCTGYQTAVSCAVAEPVLHFSPAEVVHRYVEHAPCAADDEVKTAFQARAPPLA